MTLSSQRAIWCVKDKLDIWCAVADGSEPNENEANVKTTCGDWIVLPHGTARRVPTCHKCRASTHPEHGGGR
jgi:hypothetical protein